MAQIKSAMKLNRQIWMPHIRKNDWRYSTFTLYLHKHRVYECSKPPVEAIRSRSSTWLDISSTFVPTASSTLFSRSSSSCLVKKRRRIVKFVWHLHQQHEQNPQRWHFSPIVPLQPLDLLSIKSAMWWAVVTNWSVNELIAIRAVYCFSEWQRRQILKSSFRRLSHPSQWK